MARRLRLVPKRPRLVDVTPDKRFAWLAGDWVRRDDGTMPGIVATVLALAALALGAAMLYEPTVRGYVATWVGMF